MLVQSIVITLVLTFGWIGMMLLYQRMSRPAYNFRTETQQVLERIRDGRADLVYSEASPFLQETMIAERFLELASDIRATLGAFHEILAIKQVESTSGPGGETGLARATLLFDQGKISAHFSYHRSDGRWRLLGLNIRIPEHLKKEVASRSEIRAVRVEAPAEVHALVQRLLERVRGGENGAIYDESSPTFKQSIDRETFLELQEQRRSVLGKYVRILDTLESWRNQSRNSAQVSVVVQYEKAKATVTIGFLVINGQWKLAHYKIVMPQPRIPAASTSPEPSQP